MSVATQTRLTDELLQYVRNISRPEDNVRARLRTETAGLPMGVAMQIPPEEGILLEFLVKLTGAQRILEIGTFTGYSTLCLANTGAHIVTCDVTKRWLSIAQPHWEQAGVHDRIEFREGDARETIKAETGPFDLVFIDADKASYGHYYEAALELVRTGGLIVLDNTLLTGKVIDDEAQDADTTAIRQLNERLRDDERVDLVVLPIADGITLARKR